MSKSITAHLWPFAAGLVTFMFMIFLPPLGNIHNLSAGELSGDNSQKVATEGAQEGSTTLKQDEASKKEGTPSPDEYIIFDSVPILLSAPAPVYPEKALEDGVEDDVWVKALVDKEGNVRDAIIMKSSGLEVGFEESALKAAKERKYRPALLNNEPVIVWVAYKVAYRLDKDSEE